MQCWLVVLAGLVFPVGACVGEDYITSVSVGFDGYYQLGRWSPIQVEYRNPRVDNWELTVVVPDPDGHPTRSRVTGSDGLTTMGGRAIGLFRMGKLNQPIEVQITRYDEVLDTFVLPANSEANRPLTTNSSLWLLVGSTEIFQNVPSWLDDRAADAELALPRNIIAVHRDDASLLPETVEEYDSVDIVVIGDSYDMTPTQSLALQKWVERGGRLVVSIGSRWEEFQASPVAEWLPIVVDRPRGITSLGPLTTLVTTTTGINLFETIQGVSLLSEGGRVLAGGSEGALVVRAARGLGTVTVTAFDLDHPVVLEWEPAPEMALALVDMSDIATVRDAASAGNADALGTSHSELQSQLVTIVDQYDGVSPITNFSVLGLLTAYLIAIGIADYLLVHRWFKRPNLTWVTLPVWLTFGVLLTSAYGRSHVSSSDAARRVELIDVIADTGQVQVHDWLALYSASPKRQGVRETVDSEWAGVGNVSLSWAGLPEASFRGMFRQSGLSFGDPVYAYDRDTSGLSEFPRLPNSSRVLEGETWLSADGLVESTLRDDGRGQLSGTFTHHLPLPISDWFIAYRNTVYYPSGETLIEPNAPLSVDRLLHPVIRSYLTGAGAERTNSEPSRTDARMTRKTYDASVDADLDDIIRMVSFHAAAGGTGYTSLRNIYLERLELSRLLDLQRAVVFGRLDDSVVSLEIDGVPVDVDTDTYIRIVIPVESP